MGVAETAASETAGALDRSQLEKFERDGVLVVEDVIDRDAVLAPLVAEYQDLMARLTADWTAAGALPAGAAEGDFFQMVRAAYGAGLDFFQPLDISLPGGEIEPDTPFHAGPAAFRLLTDARLLDLVESLIGPEITSCPIQHVRLKPPATELRGDEIRAHITATDWHQDRAVALSEADETRMVTAWVAVTDATEENGCLQAIRGSHLGAMLPHCPNPQVGIPEALLAGARPEPLPVRAGGVVLFHPLTVHGSLANRSDGVRWSFDLRYIRTGDPTGRSIFPDFVARSQAQPETALRDPTRWRKLWEDARARLAGRPAEIHRWAPDAAHCA